MVMYNACEEQLRPTTKALVAPYRLAMETLCPRDAVAAAEDDSSVLRDLSAAMQGGEDERQSPRQAEWPTRSGRAFVQRPRVARQQLPVARLPMVQRGFRRPPRRAEPEPEPSLPGDDDEQEKSEEQEEEEERENFIARKLQKEIGSELSAIPLPGETLDERSIIHPRITRGRIQQE